MTMIEGLSKRLWLRADSIPLQGGEGGVWLDESGSGNDAVARGAVLPAYVEGVTNTGAAAVRFDGSGNYDFAANPMAGATEGELWVVVKADAGGDWGSWAFGGDIGPSDQSQYPFNGQIYESFGRPSGQRARSSNYLSTLTAWNIYRVAVDPINGLRVWLNGAPTAMVGAEPAAITWTANARLGRGRKNATDDAYFRGHIAEVIMRDVVSTQTEAEGVLRELATQHGINSFGTPIDATGRSGSVTFTATDPTMYLRLHLDAPYEYEAGFATPGDPPRWDAFTGWERGDSPDAPPTEGSGGITSYYYNVGDIDPRVLFGLGSDRAVYVRPAGLIVGQDYSLTWQERKALPAQPYTPESATDIGGASGTASYDAVGVAYRDTSERWFSWTAPETGEYEFTAEEPWGYCEVHDATGSYIGYFQADEAGQLNERRAESDDYAFHATAGEQYLVVIYPYSDPLPEEHVRQLSWRRIPTPSYVVPNDEPAGALPLPLVIGSGVLTYDDTGATMGADRNPGSIWYALPRVAEPVDFTAATVPSTIKRMHERYVDIYRLNPDGSASWEYGGVSGSVYGRLMPDVDYLLCIYRSYNAPAGWETSGRLEWEARTPPAPPSNSSQATATPLTLPIGTGSLTLSTAGADPAQGVWYAIDVSDVDRQVHFWTVPSDPRFLASSSVAVYNGVGWPSLPVAIPAGAAYFVRISNRSAWGDVRHQLQWDCKAPVPGMVTPRALAADEQVVSLERAFPTAPGDEVYTLTVTAPTDGAFTFHMSDLAGYEGQPPYGEVITPSGTAFPVPRESQSAGGVVKAKAGQVFTVKLTLRGGSVPLPPGGLKFGWGMATDLTWHPWRDTLAFVPLAIDGKYDPNNPWGDMYLPDVPSVRDWDKRWCNMNFPMGKYQPGSTDVRVLARTTGFPDVGWGRQAFGTINSLSEKRQPFVWLDDKINGIYEGAYLDLMSQGGKPDGVPWEWDNPGYTGDGELWHSLGSYVSALIGADAHNIQRVTMTASIQHVDVWAGHRTKDSPEWLKVYPWRPLFDSAYFADALGFPELKGIYAHDRGWLDSVVAARHMETIEHEWSEPDTRTVRLFHAVRLMSTRAASVSWWPGGSAPIPAPDGAFRVSATIRDSATPPRGGDVPRTAVSDVLGGPSSLASGMAPLGVGEAVIAQTGWVESRSLSLGEEATADLVPLRIFDLAADSTMHNPGGVLDTQTIKNYQGYNGSIFGEATYGSIVEARTLTVREFPPSFRIGTYARNVPPLEAPPPEPGRMIRPEPNLDGRHEATTVWFSA